MKRNPLIIFKTLMTLLVVPLTLSSCVVRDYWFYHISFTDGTYMSKEIKDQYPNSYEYDKPYTSFKLLLSQIEDDGTTDYYNLDNIVIYKREIGVSKYQYEFYSLMFYTQKEGEDYIHVNLHDLRFSHSNPNKKTWPTNGSVYFAARANDFYVYLDNNGIKRVVYGFYQSTAEMTLETNDS